VPAFRHRITLLDLSSNVTKRRCLTISAACQVGEMADLGPANGTIEPFIDIPQIESHSSDHFV